MLRRGYEFAPGYRLQEFLGRGQFGQVWRASAPGGTAAAIKFIDLTGGQGEKEFDAIKRIKQIRHANLMPILAIWLLDEQGNIIEDEPDDAIATINVGDLQAGATSPGTSVARKEPATLVVAMLLGGASLLDRMEECIASDNSGIPPRELLSYMEDSAKGLDFLNDARHDLGEGPVAIQHCDVKPANIVVLGNSAMICDFGLARILTRTQVTATSASGTPAYMAPEAISGKPSKTSDQYSLAVTYYHLRTGELPVADGTLFEVLEAHRSGKLSFAGVSEQERAVLKRATELSWEDRFECNADMVDALRDALRAGGYAPASQLGLSMKRVSENTDTLKTGNFQQGETQHVPSKKSLATEVDLDPHGTRVSVPDASSGSTPTTPSDPTKKPIALIVVSAVGGLLLLVGIGSLFLSGDASNDPAPEPPPVAGNPDIDPMRERVEGSIAKTKDELLALALQYYDSQTATAIDLFAEALTLDASLVDLEPVVLMGHSDSVERIFVTQLGSLVTIGYDKTPFKWSAELDEASPPVPMIADRFQLPIYPDAIDLLHDGTTVIAGASNQLVMVPAGESAGGVPLRRDGLADEVLAVAAHPVQPRALVCLADQTLVVIATDQKTLAEVTSVTCPEPMTRIAYSPSGDFVLALGETSGALYQYRWDEIIEAKQKNEMPTAVRVSAEGTRNRKFAAVSDSRAQQFVWLGDELGALSKWTVTDTPKIVGGRHQVGSSPIESLAANEHVVAAGNAEGRLLITGQQDGRVILDRSISPSVISCIDLSRDGKWVALGDYAGNVWLLRADATAKTGAKLSTGASVVQSIQIDPVGNRLIAGVGMTRGGGTEGALCVWDLRRCKLIAETRPLDLNLNEGLNPPLTNEAAKDSVAL